MNIHRKQQTTDEGFTLMEVLIAMTLIAMILAGGFAALIQGNRMIEDARDVTRVSQVIQSEIESLRTMNWDDLEGMLNPSSFAEAKFHPYYQKVDLQGQFAEKYGDRYTLWRGAFYQDMDGDGDEDQIGAYIWVGWKAQRGNYYKWQRFYTRFTEDGLNDYFYRAFPSE